MKVSNTRTLSRKVFLSFVFLVIVLSLAALFVRDSISEKLERISKLSEYNGMDQSQLDNVLLLLHKADNDFQESLIAINRKESIVYKQTLSAAFDQIDDLLKRESNITDSTSLKQKRIKIWYKKKLDLSDNLLRLRYRFDSLLNVYATFSESKANNGTTYVVTQGGKNDVESSSDTIKKTVVKKRLIKRVVEAIKNKEESSAGTEIRHSKYVKETDTIRQNALTGNVKTDQKRLQQLRQQNVKLLRTQRELIVLNATIINELENTVNAVREIDYKMANEFNEMALESYRQSTSSLNRLYLVALLLVLAFSILLILFIIQLNRIEVHLRKEIERSVALAQQKMDLLYHMSHEIRNPLTSINGFLYIFRKSNMSPKQLEMLDSITLSSNMLLRTLNDTLDAAKMESSELKINIDPFDPNVTLAKLVESIRFSATRKKLTLDYSFKGTENAVVLGDSFRLGQIMANLLSNAIKYTWKGGITVNAQLSPRDNRLQVDVTDTGEGISEQEQANLFSKYYQASSSKGQAGTGLGLFICKQLITMQGGKISVKSKVGEGTTFSFVIPYRKSEEDNLVENETNTNDPIVRLNDKSVLQ